VDSGVAGVSDDAKRFHECCTAGMCSCGQLLFCRGRLPWPNHQSGVDAEVELDSVQNALPSWSNLDENVERQSSRRSGRIGRPRPGYHPLTDKYRATRRLPERDRGQWVEKAEYDAAKEPSGLWTNRRRAPAPRRQNLTPRVFAIVRSDAEGSLLSRSWAPGRGHARRVDPARRQEVRLRIQIL